MITSLRNRIRPDDLKTQVRGGGRGLVRRIYLASVLILLSFIFYYTVGQFLFLEAYGLVDRDRSVVAAISNSRVAEVYVHPGQRVEKGTPLLKLQSPDVLMELGRYETRRGDVLRRSAEIQRRLQVIDALKPLAATRQAKAAALESTSTKLGAGGFASASHLAGVARDAYESARELAVLEAEEKSLKEEAEMQAKMRTDLDALIKELKSIYDYGHVGGVHAAADGTVGPRIADVGQVVRTGDPLLEILTGPTYVLAYLPSARAYDLDDGDQVIVTDGSSRVKGEVERRKNVADRLPSEFQSQFGAVDRREVFRVKFASAPPFALLSKVRVVNPASPSNVIALIHGAIDNLVERTLLRLDHHTPRSRN